MGQQATELTPAEWATLKAGPACVFALVATADSHVDRREWSTYLESVRSATGHPDALVRNVMAALAPELGDAPGASVTSGDPTAALREIRAVCETQPEAGVEFRRAMFELGIAVAEASGAQLTRTFIKGQGLGWTNSSGTSAVEHAALEAVAEALGLS